MKWYLHLFNQRQVDVCKIGIGNIDKNAIITDATSNNSADLTNFSNVGVD